MSNHAGRSKRLFAGFLAAVLALTVAPIIGLASPAGAAPPAPVDPIGTGNFCEDTGNTEPFTDVADNDPARANIICLVATQITTGVTATTYEPNSFVTRRQMALFLVRTAAEADRLEIGDNIEELPAPGANGFTDVANESQAVRNAISQLAQAEIAGGFPDNTYRPAAPVSRRQMAAFIDRLYEYLTGAELPRATEDYFADDNSDSDAAEASTNAVARAGIFTGNSDGTFRPAQEITRRQMASVLTRTLQVLFENGEINKWSAARDDAGTATIRPELVSAQIVETRTAQTATPTRLAGTYVRYTFDEPVGATGAIVPASFRVYNAAGAPTNGNVVTVEPGRTTVEVRFDALNTAALASNLTVATVAAGAIADDAGNTNPEGDAAIGSAATNTLVAGQTTAPDLVSVGSFRQGAAVGQTAVNFVFDEAAVVQNTTFFSLVTTSNATVPCTASTDASIPSGGTVAGGSGTTTLTVLCTNPTIPGDPGGVPLTAANVARGAVDTDAVRDAGGDANALQTADVADGGNTAGPDLVSVIFVQGGADDPDRALFIFDRDVTATGAANLFRIYNQDSSETSPQSVLVSNTTPTQVLATFLNNSQLDAAVGASVLPNAVVGGAAGANQRDEVGVTNSNQTSTTPGRTNGPDLIGVAVTNTEGFQPSRATYTFDENVAPVALDAVDPAVNFAASQRFKLYRADGSVLSAIQCRRGPSAIAATNGPDSAIVTCIFGAPNSAATNAAVVNSVLGTVVQNAVTDAGGTGNPEGAERVTGGTGTSAS